MLLFIIRRSNVFNVPQMSQIWKSILWTNSILNQICLIFYDYAQRRKRIWNSKRVFQTSRSQYLYTCRLELTRRIISLFDLIWFDNEGLKLTLFSLLSVNNIQHSISDYLAGLVLHRPNNHKTNSVSYKLLTQVFTTWPKSYTVFSDTTAPSDAMLSGKDNASVTSIKRPLFLFTPLIK